MYTGKADLLRIIHGKCMDCTCDEIKRVKQCPITDCPLWPFRMGKDPYKTKRTATQAQLDALAAGRDKARGRR